MLLFKDKIISFGKDSHCHPITSRKWIEGKTSFWNQLDQLQNPMECEV